MDKLTKKEEEIMKILWKLKKGFVKDILAEYPDPKPPYNTISSMVRILQEKRLVGFKQYGNTYEYYPLLSKDAYRKRFMKAFISDYFDDSLPKAVAAFIEEEQLGQQEVEEILKLIKSK
ncbi:Predicted transcriptional regulator [Cyclobacterium lianum]|uniref:Predicted transcriptional regulator n=1 Tax=Cyclobacterium lianum TaxID=388280 RepID=A0A1M7QV28_9BACT|nr:BlaI/MecI/CopY family transcriptional regulator [Cyclobacterium lianum]SHN35364.1 Predicted transcriptional regulator [Cyclobacterium lianum]